MDFGETAGDYARYRAGFPEEFFGRLARFGVGEEGQRLLDLGTGTGTLARGLARRGCRVTGLDPSEKMLEEARRLDREAQVSVEYVVATAEDTGLPASSFDAVTAGQCWHWFERGRAAAEARRVLVGGGSLVIAHFDWVPLSGNVVEATEHLIEHHNPSWEMGGGTGLYPDWLADVSCAGFQVIETFAFDVPVTYSHEDWRGRIRASAGVAASLTTDKVQRFDSELGRHLRYRFPQDPLTVPHRVFAVVCSSPPD